MCGWPMTERQLLARLFSELWAESLGLGGPERQEPVDKTPMVDWSKPIQRRDGAPAELMGVVRSGNRARYFVKFCLGTNHEDWEICLEDGIVYSPENGAHNIINVPEPERVLYINIYESKSNGSICTYGYHSRKDADEKASPNRIACVRLTYHPGQFDD